VERGELSPSYAGLKALAKATGVQVSELVALAETLEQG
jgi:transcriptional regulator with XRE-family HTH domain